MNDGSFKSTLKSVWAVIKKFFKRVWAYLKVAKMEYIVMIALFVLDLASKAIVNATVGLYDSVVLIPKFLNITNIHNYDAAFGSSWLGNALGSMGSRIFFSIFAVIASVMFVIVLVRAKGGHKLFRVALAMVTAGAMGNCIDRMFLGYVRDFIEFEYFGLTIFGQTSFWIFNFADAELVIGVILIVIYFIFIYRDKDDRKKKHALPEAELATAGEETTATAEDDGENLNGDGGAEGAVETPDENVGGDVQGDNNKHLSLNDLKEDGEESSAAESIEHSTEQADSIVAPTESEEKSEAESSDNKSDSNENTEKEKNDNGGSAVKKRSTKKKAG